jgi:PTH2 family peptidyl-tRNA hydrolase|nr:peptidyl-tRNA hydrolase [Neorhizobium tomejilense]
MQDFLDINLQSALAGFVQDCREEAPAKDADLKIWILARKDLDLSLGKFGPQAAHAAGTCMVISDRRDNSLVDDYLSQGQTKITVGVEDEDDLRKHIELCREAMLVTVLVQDAGRTELEGKTVTLGAVGPCLRSDLPGPTKRLRAFRKE